MFSNWARFSAIALSFSLYGAAPLAGDGSELIGDPAAGREKAAMCGGCHGMDGISIAPNFPNLRGQKDVYIAKQMQYFRHDLRADPTMAGIAAGLTDREIDDIAAYFYSLADAPAPPSPVPQPAATTPGDPAAGRERAQVCSACHGQDGISLQRNYPNLRGQKSAYLRKQLGAFRDGPRTDPIMTTMLRTLTDQDLDDIAAYFSGLGSPPPPAATPTPAP